MMPWPSTTHVRRLCGPIVFGDTGGSLNGAVCREKQATVVKQTNQPARQCLSSLELLWVVRRRRHRYL